MNWQDRFAPVDPAVFRDACCALFDHAEKWVGEHNEKFDIALGGGIFLMDNFGIERGEIDEEGQSLYLNSMMRFMELMKLLKSRGVELGELYKTASDPDEKQLHLAVLEAAALVPLREGGMDVDDLIAEAKPRVTQIDVLERLLGDQR